jgi:antitoxin component YwqK of YwqJK toxin-antitoxin module
VKCRKLSFESKQFINSRKEYHEAACTKLYKIGDWTFFEEDGNLLLKCSYLKYRKITVPNGKWKYYKNNNVYKIEKYKKGELELVSFDPKDF